MGANLDPSARYIIYVFSTVTSILVAGAIWFAHAIIIPKIQKKLTKFRRHASRDLCVSCYASVLIMAFSAAALTFPITLFTNNESKDAMGLSSSINFCEQDFRHSSWVAEPANTMSNLTSYVPLGILGLLGPPARFTWQPHKERRWLLVYASLVAIGMGSFALHACLTAETQSGDELPILWYCAACSYCAVDIITSSTKRRASSRGMAFVVGSTSIAATVIYLMNRNDFRFFYVMLNIYIQSLLGSLVWIVLVLDWSKAASTKDNDNAGLKFKHDVLLPLGSCVGWFTIASVWTWISEMVGCHDAISGTNATHHLIWNRFLHPLWHFQSAMVAWLLIQLLLAAHGMQRGWEQSHCASIQWFGVPYVSFK